MVVVQNLAISISIFVPFLASDVYSQEPGTMILTIPHFKGNNKTENVLSLYACQCYMESDANDQLWFDDTRKTSSCKIISQQGSTVSLIFYYYKSKSKSLTGISKRCLLKTVKEMRSGLYWKPTKAESSGKLSCILVTDMIIEKRTNLVQVLLYSFLLITLVMGTLYAAYKYDLWTKFRARWQLSQDWDRLPLSVNFQS